LCRAASAATGGQIATPLPPGEFLLNKYERARKVIHAPELVKPALEIDGLICYAAGAMMCLSAIFFPL